MGGQSLSDERGEQYEERPEQGRGLCGDGGIVRMQVLAQLRRAFVDGKLGDVSELAVDQLRATHEQQVNARDAHKGRKVSVELVVDPAGGRRGLVCAASRTFVRQ